MTTLCSTLQALVPPAMIDAEEIAHKIRIIDDSAIELAGHITKPTGNRFIDVPADMPPIVAHVGQIIYDRYYRNAGAGRGSYRTIEDRNLKRIFSEWLSAATTTKESWSPGWEVVNELNGKLILRKGKGRVRAVDQSLFQPSQHNAKVGAVRIASSSESVQPGWHYVRGVHVHETSPQETVRLYFALTRGGAVPWVHTLTKEFNEAGIPFTAKTDGDPEGYRRADAAVLYVARDRWHDLQQPLRAIYRVVQPYLREKRPLFTLPLAPGLALAEEPRNGGSFGASRSSHCAVGLWNARGESDPATRLKAIVAAFESAGVPPEKPWLATTEDFGYQPLTHVVRDIVAEVLA